MDVKVNITADDIETHIKNAVINSAVGESLVSEINAAIKDSLVSDYRHDSAVKRLTQVKVDQVIRDVLNGYEAQIKAAVVEYLGEETLNELVQGTIEHLMAAARKGMDR